MRSLIFVLIGLLGCGKALVLADDVPSSLQPAPTVKHTSTLTFQNGTYTSIFGIVPKEYKLESQETREILQKIETDSVFTLEMVASETRRILSLPGETSTIETAPKPLTGKTVRVSKMGGGWEPEIVGLSDPKEDEIKEAARLVGRYAPGASPFEALAWTAEGTASLDVEKVLTYLGYTQISEPYGTASAKRGPVPESAGPMAPVALEIEANFGSGEGESKITVELKAKGELKSSEDSPGSQSLKLEGRLAVHGQRKLADGRVVPYSLITDFAYQAMTAPASS